MTISCVKSGFKNEVENMKKIHIIYHLYRHIYMLMVLWKMIVTDPGTMLEVSKGWLDSRLWPWIESSDWLIGNPEMWHMTNPVKHGHVDHLSIESAKTGNNHATMKTGQSQNQFPWNFGQKSCIMPLCMIYALVNWNSQATMQSNCSPNH